MAVVTCSPLATLTGTSTLFSSLSRGPDSVPRPYASSVCLAPEVLREEVRIDSARSWKKRFTLRAAFLLPA